MPVLIEAFQLVGVAVLLRLRETQRGESQAKNILLIAQRDLIRDVDCLFQRGVFSDRDRFVEELKIRQHHRWHVGVVPDLFRKERVEPLAAAKEHFPIKTRFTGTIAEIIALQAVGGVVVSEGLCLRLEPGQTFLGAKP